MSKIERILLSYPASWVSIATARTACSWKLSIPTHHRICFPSIDQTRKDDSRSYECFESVREHVFLCVGFFVKESDWKECDYRIRDLKRFGFLLRFVKESESWRRDWDSKLGIKLGENSSCCCLSWERKREWGMAKRRRWRDWQEGVVVLEPFQTTTRAQTNKPDLQLQLLFFQFLSETFSSSTHAKHLYLLSYPRLKGVMRS